MTNVPRSSCATVKPSKRSARLCVSDLQAGSRSRLQPPSPRAPAAQPHSPVFFAHPPTTSIAIAGRPGMIRSSISAYLRPVCRVASTCRTRYGCCVSCASRGASHASRSLARMHCCTIRVCLQHFRYLARLLAVMLLMSSSLRELQWPPRRTLHDDTPRLGSKYARLRPGGVNSHP